jgi:hypothetical protein
MIKEKLTKGAMTVVGVDGNVTVIKPKGKEFTLQELQNAVSLPNYDGNYIEIAPTRIPGYVVIVNEEGLINAMPFNVAFKMEYGGQYFGPVVIVDAKLFK